MCVTAICSVLSPFFYLHLYSLLFFLLPFIYLYFYLSQSTLYLFIYPSPISLQTIFLKSSFDIFSLFPVSFFFFFFFTMFTPYVYLHLSISLPLINLQHIYTCSHNSQSFTSLSLQLSFFFFLFFFACWLTSSFRLLALCRTFKRKIYFCNSGIWMHMNIFFLSKFTVSIMLGKPTHVQSLKLKVLENSWTHCVPIWNSSPSWY